MKVDFYSPERNILDEKRRAASLLTQAHEWSSGLRLYGSES